MSCPVVFTHRILRLSRVALLSAGLLGQAACSEEDNQITDPTEVDEFHFVRIEDREMNAGGQTPGADIDAVALIPRGADNVAEDSIYADSIDEFTHATDGSDEDPTEALALPDAFPDFPQTDVCVEQGFVSLGGEGGELIISFFNEMTIERGDRIFVYEVGGCQVQGSDDIAIEETMDVSVGPTAQGPWLLIASGTGPILSGTVPSE